METTWLLTVLGMPLLAVLVLVALRGRLASRPRAAGWIAGGAAALSLLSTLTLIPSLRAGVDPSVHMRWIPAAGIQFGLHLDALSLPFLITEATVTLVAILYSWGYHHVDDRTPYYYALLMLFATGMAGTTIADDMFLFYIFWELMLVASCVLIALWGEGERRGAVALKYFIFTHLGSLLVLVALILLYDAAGSDGFAALRDGISLAPSLTRAAIALFMIGFCVKMAVFPLHLWLPDAHTVAPMSVTIMLAAAMLSMGTYGILRFPIGIFAAADVAPFGLPMMILGVISEFYGALMALAERDVKRIIAYSSVSQMGYILYGLGTLTRQGVSGAMLHVIYHAIVKALLFMCTGLIIRATGRRTISDLRGLGKAMPLAAIATGVGALAIAGTPPLGVFDSEWMIFAGGFQTPYLGLAVLSVLGSLLTVAYALWFWVRIFAGQQPEDLEVGVIPRAMSVPSVALAILSLVAGVLPGPIFGWAERALDLVRGGAW
ncbi:MAG: NADH-quinone oxidoreductase subunit M [Anaerolineae bacterium]|nr:NADH-quinone oxidoreductase subunit M [Anaerolineae bacterium]